MEEELIYKPELLKCEVKLSYCNRTIADTSLNTRFLCALLVGFKEEVWEIIQIENPESQLITVENLFILRLRNITDKDLNPETIWKAANEVRFRVLFRAIALDEKVTVVSFYKVFHEVFKEYFHALVK